MVKSLLKILSNIHQMEIQDSWSCSSSNRIGNTIRLALFWLPCRQDSQPCGKEDWPA
jgi:hypothetical protein